MIVPCHPMFGVVAGNDIALGTTAAADNPGLPIHHCCLLEVDMDVSARAAAVMVGPLHMVSIIK